MMDGLYRIEYKNLCGGFEIRDGDIVACAPVFRKNIAYWMKHATRIGHGEHNTQQGESI